MALREGVPLFAPELADTLSGYDPAHLTALAELEASFFWFVARNELIVGLVRRYFPDARSYLEIGCGNGGVLRAVAGTRAWARLAGSDLHPTGLAQARARLPQGVELVQMDARDIPAAAAFDLIGAFDIVEHVAEDEAMLRSMRTAIPPGGGAIVAVPQHPSLWSRADEVAHHQRRYRIGELEDKLARSGFEVVFSSSFTTVLLPLMALSRLKARGTAGDAEVRREFQIGPALNGILKTLLRAEVRATLAGVRWPAGGSRVVVAKAV